MFYKTICTEAQKKIEKWNKHRLTLSDLVIIQIHIPHCKCKELAHQKKFTGALF